MIDPCPLCGQCAADPVSSTPYSDIFAVLRIQFGSSIDEGLETRYSPARTADEFRCRHCGLQYFSPMNAGGPDFYDALASSDRYYRGDRWEYELALDAITDRNSRVLDVGCGRGDFLVQAQQHAGSVLGAETNPDARLHLERRNLRFHAGDLAELDEEFDLICAFQVFEHLADVDLLLGPAVDRLAPGGAIFLSVPNRQRLDAHPRLEPLDCPPHHVSRWSPAQFDELARRGGLTVRAVHRQHKSRSSTVKVVLHRIVGRGRNEPGGPSWRGVLKRASLANTMAVELVRSADV